MREMIQYKEAILLHIKSINTSKSQRTQTVITNLDKSKSKAQRRMYIHKKICETK